jgi:hypothetical protein
MSHTGTFSSAKKVMDFYIARLSEEESQEAQFAQQYAALHALRYRTQALKDGLESYHIEVE